MEAPPEAKRARPAAPSAADAALQQLDGVLRSAVAEGVSDAHSAVSVAAAARQWLLRAAPPDLARQLVACLRALEQLDDAQAEAAAVRRIVQAPLPIAAAIVHTAPRLAVRGAVLAGIAVEPLAMLLAASAHLAVLTCVAALQPVVDAVQHGHGTATVQPQAELILRLLEYEAGAAAVQQAGGSGLASVWMAAASAAKQTAADVKHTAQTLAAQNSRSRNGHRLMLIADLARLATAATGSHENVSALAATALEAYLATELAGTREADAGNAEGVKAVRDLTTTLIEARNSRQLQTTVADTLQGRALLFVLASQPHTSDYFCEALVDAAVDGSTAARSSHVAAVLLALYNSLRNRGHDAVATALLRSLILHPTASVELAAPVLQGAAPQHLGRLPLLEVAPSLASKIAALDPRKTSHKHVAASAATIDFCATHLGAATGGLDVLDFYFECSFSIWNVRCVGALGGGSGIGCWPVAAGALC